MAIKTVSQLDEFNVGNSQHGSPSIDDSNALAFFKAGYLTNNDKTPARAIGGGQTNYKNGASLITTSLSSIEKSSTSYWNSLFEISKASTPPTAGEAKGRLYESYNIQYEDILKTIIWDVKSYLNYRNNLNDYNLSAIVQGDQWFQGTKSLTGNINVTNGSIGVTNGSISVTTGNIHINGGGLTATETISSSVGRFSDLSSYKDQTYTLSVNTGLSIDCNVVRGSSDISNLYFDGYAYGLNDRNPDSDGSMTTTHTTCGTWNGTIPTDLLSSYSRTGDPVCFKDGRPYELTCVNCATSAYNIIKSDGTGWNVGTAGLISTPFVASKTVVKFVNGIPVECNEIDYAHHAYWSDLGERYLADTIYEPGTLVKFGGEKEITIADTEVNAIVSTKAFDLNARLKGGTVIALCGRVPTKVIGKIQKFDKIMLSNNPGIACKWDGKSRVIGRALESSDNVDVKLVECVTRFSL